MVSCSFVLGHASHVLLFASLRYIGTTPAVRCYPSPPSPFPTPSEKKKHLSIYIYIYRDIHISMQCGSKVRDFIIQEVLHLYIIRNLGDRGSGRSFALGHPGCIQGPRILYETLHSEHEREPYVIYSYIHIYT